MHECVTKILRGIMVVKNVNVKLFKKSWKKLSV
ncbi:Uncharacterised protein [Mycobacterium tuberculosis]|nr:Uncharacterised protein [Mycobacterium tuberculosis]